RARLARQSLIASDPETTDDRTLRNARLRRGRGRSSAGDRRRALSRRRCGVLEARAGTRRAPRRQSTGADSDGRAAGWRHLDGERSDPDPAGPALSRIGPASAGRRETRAGHPRPRVHRRKLLFGDRHHRLPGTLLYDTDEPLRERIRAGTRARLHEMWDTFADVFAATPFLSGDRLGSLDLLACVVSKWSGARKHLAQSRPAFHGLLTKIEADPVVARVFARHWPAPS